MRAALALILAVALAAAAVASELDLDAGDGWYTWRVPATEKAGNWCCVEWSSGRATPKVCDLDGKRFGVNHDSDGYSETGEMQLYAKMNGGELETLRALSARCEVRAMSEIRDLGVVDTNDSLDWLGKQIDSRPKDADDVMMAIIVHDGERPVQMLFDIVESKRRDFELREHALFWLVQSDSALAYDYLDRLLTGSTR
jgi:hypothetical protein